MIYLTGARPDFQTERTIAQLQRDLADEFPIKRIEVLNSLAAGLKLRNLLRAQPQPVHAWGDAALGAATICGCGRIVYSPPAEIPAQFGYWMRMALGDKSVHVVCPSEAAREHFSRQGVREDRLDIIPPGLDSDRIPPRDIDLRRRLGFDDTDFVTLLSGESTAASAHRIGVWSISILHVIDPRFRVLTWGRGAQTDLLVRFGQRLHQQKLVKVAEQTLERAVGWEEMVSVADALLVPATGLIATLPIAAAAAAGIPIVAADSVSNREILNCVPGAHLVPRATPKTLAQAVLKISQGEFATQKSGPINSIQSVSARWRELYQRLSPLQNRLSSSRY
jgi:glycosyltransferase involved in cell wall biosynthesis